MVINGKTLLDMAPIDNMLEYKKSEHGVSYGLGEAGYDIRIKQKIVFTNKPKPEGYSEGDGTKIVSGRFVLASAIEHFNMPSNLIGVVHDKSTWARQGLSVFNTVIESGWRGYLTLELVYHGTEDLIIPAGAGIAQVIFHKTSDERNYTGKYQNQKNEPVAFIASK